MVIGEGHNEHISLHYPVEAFPRTGTELPHWLKLWLLSTSKNELVEKILEVTEMDKLSEGLDEWWKRAHEDQWNTPPKENK